jgi:DNA-binding CsgD family transcriptional regulator
MSTPHGVASPAEREVPVGCRFIGRAAERALWGELVAAVPDGGDAVLLDGDPGVGKTALADVFTRAAQDAGMRMVRTQGTQSESSEPYASLHLLLLPLRDRFHSLPPPLRRALGIAFGEHDGPMPSGVLVGLAALRLLSETAESAGLLVVVEDLHWVDRGTAAALQFLSRRIAAEPILMLLTARTGEIDDDEFSAVSRWRLGPLSPAESEQVLDSTPDSPSGATRRALLELAQGNPLALSQLRGSDIAATGSAGLPTLSSRLEAAFAGRFSSLSAPTRYAVLAAAIDDSGRVVDALAAAARAVDAAPDPSWFAAAADVGLIGVAGHQVRFRHPLMRSATISAAAEAERVLVLRSLVDVVDDPGRVAWWRAELTFGPDAELADELAAAAARSAASGDAMTAVRASRYAARLSPDSVQSAEHLLNAAEQAQQAGDPELATRLLDEVEQSSCQTGQRSRAAWLREFLPGIGVVRVGGDISPVLRAIDGMRRAGDSERALGALTFLASMVWGSSPDERAGAMLLESVRDAGLAAGDPRLMFLLAAADPVNEGARVIESVHAIPAEAAAHDVDLSWLLGYALSTAGDIETTARHLGNAIEGLRQHGRTAMLSHTLVAWFWNCVARGRLPEAQAAAEECISVAVDLGDPIMRAAGLAIAAYASAIDGERPDLAAIAKISPLAIRAMDTRAIRVTLTLAQGAASLTRGRAREAERVLSRVADPSEDRYHLVFAVVSFPDLIEAEVRLGEFERASSRLFDMEVLHERWPVPLVTAALRFGRAAVRLGDDVESAVRLAESSAPDSPYLSGRLSLLIGSHLRTTTTTAAAVTVLRRAHAMLEEAGADVWAERARRELRLLGEAVVAPAMPARSALSAAEIRVTDLAVEGLSNREIADRLYLSPRTVGAHLYTVFRKLGVGGRDELAAALDPGSEWTSASRR